MKASSYFTDGEIEMAMSIFRDVLSNSKLMNAYSQEYDAGDKFYNLREKIEIYFEELGDSKK